MTIGYAGEDSVHRAFIKGLAKRWCPGAHLVEGYFRGSTRESLRREYKKNCAELFFKGADVVVFLTDNDKSEWRERWKDEISKLPQERLEQIILGIADRNIESWLTCDSEWLSGVRNIDPAEFDCEDPKTPFTKAMGITRDDRKEEEIADLVCEAPLKKWLRNDSFKKFYDQARDIGQRLKCGIENIKDQ